MPGLVKALETVEWARPAAGATCCIVGGAADDFIVSMFSAGKRGASSFEFRQWPLPSSPSQRHIGKHPRQHATCHTPPALRGGHALPGGSTIRPGNGTRRRHLNPLSLPVASDMRHGMSHPAFGIGLACNEKCNRLPLTCNRLQNTMQTRRAMVHPQTPT